MTNSVNDKSDNKANRLAFIGFQRTDQLTDDEMTALKQSQNDAIEYLKKKNPDLRVMRGDEK